MSRGTITDLIVVLTVIFIIGTAIAALVWWSVGIAVELTWRHLRGWWCRRKRSRKGEEES